MNKHYKRKTIISTLSLFFQSGYSAVLGFFANLVLTIVISPSSFGVYITVLSLISIFNYFSDIGLSAALIQKKEINEEDLKTSFTVQQIMILSLIGLGLIISPMVKKFYHLPPAGIYLYYSVLIAFFLSSLKNIPSILLERKIEFQKIVFVQALENTLFYFTVIIFALLKLEILSFALAVLIRAFFGLVLIYRLSFWQLKIGFNRESFKKLISFGLAFQTNSCLALVKDDLITLFLGKILGFEKLGYLGFAKKWAEAPIRIVMDNVAKISFPLMARFQHDKNQLKKIIEKILFYQSLIILPATFGLVLIMPKLIAIIPRYQKWQPAIPLFYFFALSAIFSSYSSPFTNFFNSIGQVKKSFYLMVFWTVATWILTPPLTFQFGIYGFPLCLLILSSTFIFVIFLAKKTISFNFINQTFSSLFSSLIMSFIVFYFLKFPFPSLISLLGGVILGIISYSLVLYFVFKINFFKIYRSFYE